MFSSTALLTSILLLGNALAFPQFPVKRDPATCVQDNLLRCFINTKSTAAASAFCAALTPLTSTVATVTATAAVTTTTTAVASTETDGVTVLITSTIVVPVVATAIVNVKKRAVAPPLCYTNGGTSYAPSRLTSACSCIGVPATTVSDYTYTASTSTATIVSVVEITTTTSLSTTSTVLVTNTLSLTTSLTSTTTLPTPSVCGAPSSSNLVANPSFECGTLSSFSWTTDVTPGVYAATLEGAPSNGLRSLFTYTQLIKDEGFPPGKVFQLLNTVPGTTYNVSFDMHMDGFGCYWTVQAAGTIIATNEVNQLMQQTGFQSYSGTFVASGTTSELDILFRSGTWGYADWMWDNFVVTPIPS